MDAVLEVPEGYPQTILSEEIGVPPETGDGGLVGDLAEGGSGTVNPKKNS